MEGLGDRRRCTVTRTVLAPVIVTVLALLAGACRASAPVDTGTGAGGTGPGGTGAAPARTTPGSSRPLLRVDARRDVIDDLQTYWTAKVAEQTGGAFTPVAANQLFPFDADRLPPPCEAARRVGYDQLKGNAYFCPSSGTVAWDEGELFPRLDREVGPAATKLVLAHEWGHVVQQQLGIKGSPIVLELQADCLAGMWVGESAVTNGLIDSADYGQAMAGLLQLSDRLEVPPNDPSAHGSPFDRTVAFRDGLETRTCLDYAEHPPVVAALDITSREPTPPLDLDQALSELVRALNDWFTATHPGFEPVTDLRPFDRATAPAATCGTEHQVEQVVRRFNVWLCPSEHYVLYDRAYLRRVFDGLGVGALATALAVQWDGLAEGFAEGAPGFANLLGIPFRECVAGAFLRTSATAPTTRFRLSLAELNGAVGYVLLQPDQPGDPATPTLLSAFLAARYLENGVRHGNGVCHTPVS